MKLVIFIDGPLRGQAHYVEPDPYIYIYEPAQPEYFIEPAPIVHLRRLRYTVALATWAGQNHLVAYIDEADRDISLTAAAAEWPRQIHRMRTAARGGATPPDRVDKVIPTP